MILQYMTIDSIKIKKKQIEKKEKRKTLLVNGKVCNPELNLDGIFFRRVERHGEL